MRSTRAIFVVLALAWLAALSGSARAARAEMFADLGPAATTGQAARDGIDARALSLHLSMACGNELEFMRRFAFSKRLGKKGEDPATPFIEKDIAEWPLTLMLGKAALLANPDFEPVPTRVGRPICSGRLGTEDEVKRDWVPLASDKVLHREESAVDLVNRVYGELFTYLGNSIKASCHLLMQNSSRYLKNKLMMAELSQQGHREEFDVIAELNEELRIWLLKRMQRIAEEDFVEYNSKPYGRLSHFSLLNLIDYACDIHWNYELAAQMQQADTSCDEKDRAIVTAAAAVLDLSAAKASVGSLGARRLIPYRRLAVENKKYYDGRPLTEMGQGADTMIGALQVWTGQLRFAPFGNARPDTFGQLVFYSTSRYRPDAMILSMAVDKSTPRQQQYRHGTREAYVSGDGWLITAGGTDERAAQGLTFPGFTLYALSPRDDRGVGVPTTLMTDAVVDETVEQRRFSRVQDFLRFDGKDVGFGSDNGNEMKSYSNNNCIAGAFACGLRPRKPAGFDDAACAKPIGEKFVAIDSTLCPAIGAPADPARGIYIAFYDHGGEWGFFEVAQRTAFASIDDFIARVRDRNSAHMSGWASKSADDEITYVTTDNRTLEFTPEDEDFGADRRACGVVNSQDDSRFTISNVPASQAAGCAAVGRRIRINLEDEENPVRQAEDGAPLDGLF